MLAILVYLSEVGFFASFSESYMHSVLLPAAASGEVCVHALAEQMRQLADVPLTRPEKKRRKTANTTCSSMINAACLL